MRTGWPRTPSYVAARRSPPVAPLGDHAVDRRGMKLGTVREDDHAASMWSGRSAGRSGATRPVPAPSPGTAPWGVRLHDVRAERQRRRHTLPRARDQHRREEERCFGDPKRVEAPAARTTAAITEAILARRVSLSHGLDTPAVTAVRDAVMQSDLPGRSGSDPQQFDPAGGGAALRQSAAVRSAPCPPSPVLALAAAFLHAFWNLLIARARDPRPRPPSRSPSASSSSRPSPPSPGTSAATRSRTWPRRLRSHSSTSSCWPRPTAVPS